ncbi:MAG: hypothetical protein HZB51_00625 [Chloroflexi bacterium]|nr:hypothetical protein [Chloroflexota bacterium]
MSGRTRTAWNIYRAQIRRLSRLLYEMSPRRQLLWPTLSRQAQDPLFDVVNALT